MSNVVSIHSFRGGTGKSNLTANLAAQTALRGRRVAVVDTDIQSPGVHALFGLEERLAKGYLNDFLFGRSGIEDCAHDVSQTVLPGGGPGALFIVPARLETGEIAKVLREGYDVRLLHRGFKQLIGALRLDYLFIDTHPGLNEETLLSIAMSHVLVILLRPDRQDYQGTAVTVDVARTLGVPRLYLALNKVLPSVERAALREQVERAYQAPLAGLLQLSEEMIHLGSGGLFSLLQPEHAVSREMRAMAALIDSGDGAAAHG